MQNFDASNWNRKFMRVSPCLISIFLMGAVLPSASVSAAVTCVMNDATGRYEARKAPTPGRGAASECAVQSRADLIAALTDRLDESVGTRIVDGVIVTNAAKMLEPPQRTQAHATGSARSQANGEAPLASAMQPEKLNNSSQMAPLSMAKPLAAWEVLSTDVRLANTFERWAKAAGYKVQWDAGKHVLISATLTFKGDFEDAIRQALSTPAILYSPYPLEACMYQQTPPLIRITRQGEQAKECPDLF